MIEAQRPVHNPPWRARRSATPRFPRGCASGGRAEIGEGHPPTSGTTRTRGGADSIGHLRAIGRCAGDRDAPSGLDRLFSERCWSGSDTLPAFRRLGLDLGGRDALSRRDGLPDGRISPHGPAVFLQASTDDDDRGDADRDRDAGKPRRVPPRDGSWSRLSRPTWCCLSCSPFHDGTGGCRPHGSINVYLRHGLGADDDGCRGLRARAPAGRGALCGAAPGGAGWEVLLIWVSAMAVLAPLSLGGYEVTSEARVEEVADPDQPDPDGCNRARPIGCAKSAAQLTPVYGVLTEVAACVFALLMAGETPLVAVIHAMSTMATSGINAGRWADRSPGGGGGRGDDPGSSSSSRCRGGPYSRRFDRELARPYRGGPGGPAGRVSPWS